MDEGWEWTVMGEAAKASEMAPELGTGPMLRKGMVRGHVRLPADDLTDLRVVMSAGGTDFATCRPQPCEPRDPDGTVLCDYRIVLPLAPVRQGGTFDLALETPSVTRRALGSLSLALAQEKSAYNAALNRRPDGTRLRGWAVAPEAFEAAGGIAAAIYLDGDYHATCPFEVHRADVFRQLSGNVINGFDMELPDALYDGRKHQIVAIDEVAGMIFRNSFQTWSPQDLYDALERDLLRLGAA